MNEKIGQLAFPLEDNGGFPADKLYSEATAEVMDAEVKAIVDEAYKRTLVLMEERKEQVRLVAELLLEKETISHNDVSQLIGARPWSAGKEYDEFVTGGFKEPVADPQTEQAAAEEPGEDAPVGPVAVQL